MRTILERNYRKDLKWFFRQWLDEKGLPDLRFENVKAARKGSKFEVSFDIAQGEKVYIMDVPVTIYSGGMKIKDSFRVDKKTNSFSMVVDMEPEKMVMDEDYDIARRLSNKEIPPVIAQLIGDEKILIALPVSKNEPYSGISDMLKEKDALRKEIKDIKDSDIKASSIIIIGNDNPLVKRLYGKPETIDAGFSIIVKTNPLNHQKVIGIINGKVKGRSLMQHSERYFTTGNTARSPLTGAKIFIKGSMNQKGGCCESHGTAAGSRGLCLKNIK